MKTRTNTSVVLSKVARLERVMGELYVFYATVFSDNDGARAVFEKLKKEEDAHLNQVLFQKRLVDREPGQFPDMEVDLTQLEQLIGQIENAIASGAFNLKDAVEFALRVEEGACEAIVRSDFAKYNEALARLTSFLTMADDGHAERLRTLISQLMK